MGDSGAFFISFTGAGQGADGHFERTYGPSSGTPGWPCRSPAKRSGPRAEAGLSKGQAPPAGRAGAPAGGRLQRDLLLGGSESPGPDKHGGRPGQLMDILCNYAAYRRCVPILVFDAYKVKGGVGSVEKYHNLNVVYTKEPRPPTCTLRRPPTLSPGTTTPGWSPPTPPSSSSSWGRGLRVSSQAFQREVQEAEEEIRRVLSSQ